MYRKRDRSQEQSRFLFLYGRECRARVSWMECGMAVVLCVSVMCLCRRWIKRKGPHRCDADPFLIFHVCASYASWIASLGQTSAQVPQLKHFSGSIL